MAKKSLTILYVYGYPMKIGGHLGSGFAMAKRLTEQGHRIIVIAPGAGDVMVKAHKRIGAELRVVPLGKKSGRLRLPSTKGWRYIADIAQHGRADIIHCMDHQTVAQGYLAAIKTGKKFFCTEPGGNADTIIPPPKARVIIFSKEQQDIFSNIYHHPANNLKIIRARIDTDVYNPAVPSDEFMKRYGLSKSAITVGIAVRLEAEKEHKIRALLEFVKSYDHSEKKINFYVAGDGSCRAALQAEVEKLNNPAAAIHFIGPVYDMHEVNQFYNACDIVVGSGRGAMEAMACKKTVIVPGKKGQADLVGPDTIDHIARYNFSGRHFRSTENATTLAALFKEITRNPRALQQHSEFCYEYVKQYLSAEIGAAQLIDWYNTETIQSTRVDFLRWYAVFSLQKLNASLKSRLKRARLPLARIS